MRDSVFMLAALLALPATGCFEKEGWAPTVNDRKQIKANVLKAAPAMKYKINAQLEDKAVYLGLDVDKEEVRPGGTVRLTHYWRVKKSIANWKLFVHLIGPGAYENADHKPVNGLYPVAQWKPGEVIRDQHVAKVPTTIRGDKIKVLVGLWKGDERMKIKGPQDSENRVLAATLKVKQ